MRFHKYQALGNDYLVLEEPTLEAELVRRICDRHFGLGSDGILLESTDSDGVIRLRILNPDGSEAEKSGNGLRIFARYLWDQGRVGEALFQVRTLGGEVSCQVREAGKQVFVEMGRASFQTPEIPVAGPAREVIAEPLEIQGRALKITALTVGNPHCVIHLDASEDTFATTSTLAKTLGPVLETHGLFPKRTNVQFVHVIDRHRIRIEIWERGAGYTLASGSSSCAAAAASVRLGLCDSPLTVEMPGGSLHIEVRPNFSLSMLGPVQKVAEGQIANELVE
jgi:diaminopimelate epimerase